jgi:hypothetical protein
MLPLILAAVGAAVGSTNAATQTLLALTGLGVGAAGAIVVGALLQRRKSCCQPGAGEEKQ